MSELTRRILFAVIAAPASIAIVYFGDWALAILLSILSGLAAWELFRIARETGAFPLEPAGIGLAALLPIAVCPTRQAVLRARRVDGSIADGILSSAEAFAPSSRLCAIGRSWIVSEQPESAQAHSTASVREAGRTVAA